MAPISLTRGVLSLMLASGMNALAGTLPANPPPVTPAASGTDTPAFDRPGIAFSPAILPPGTVAWEQGLPDFAYDSSDGTRSWLFSGDTNLRIGLLKDLELQVGVPLWNYTQQKTDGVRSSDDGFGDLRLSLKTALPSPDAKLTWAALGGVTFATGADAFSAGDPKYDLGIAAAYAVTEAISFGAYVNFDRLRSISTWTLSPEITWSVNDKTGVYLEAGFNLASGGGSGVGNDGEVVGGGLTYMITPVVQLDASVDFGVGGTAPDITGGIGLSIFFK